MCGICLICSLDKTQNSSLPDLCSTRSLSLIGRRGPDAEHMLKSNLWNEVPAVLTGFVLHLRGELTPQPLVNGNGDALLWNGEIFDGIEVKESENDTQVLFEKLVSCLSEKDVLSTVQSIQGPWTVVYWQASTQRLWFGRDVFGRRSLLWHLPQKDGIFALASVPVHFLDCNYQEVPSLGLYMMEMKEFEESRGDKQCPQLLLHLFPWQGVVWPGDDGHFNEQTVAHKLCLSNSSYISLRLHSDQPLRSWMPVLNKNTPDSSLPLLNVADNRINGPDFALILKSLEEDGLWSVLVDQFIQVLQRAVDKRVHNLLRHCCHGTSVPVPSNDVGDFVQVHEALQNIAFTDNIRTTVKVGKDPVSPATAASVTMPQRAFMTGGLEMSQTGGLEMSQTGGLEMSQAGTGKETVPLISNGSHAYSYPAFVAVLFSGGIDSTVIAALADRCLPKNESIDLINVAFEQKVQHLCPNKDRESDRVSCSSFSVPDRQTGYSALAELNPARQWNFVEINVTQEELQQQRSQHIRHLVYPLASVLDDSIGCAVWFAARGQGVLGNGPYKGSQYTSTAKVILCGMGADEQLAGYSRHRVRFQQDSWSGLVSEVNMEMHRISARNLGRDDRIISDHGKESRFPFLDEDVVTFLASVPIERKADLRLPRGIGEKLLLRLSALHLGLPATAVQPKRAIQFGSRIAKMEQRKEKGSHFCKRLFQE